MNRILARLLCSWRGHLRGKLVRQDQRHKFYACPRCNRETSYLIKKAA